MPGRSRDTSSSIINSSKTHYHTAPPVPDPGVPKTVPPRVSETMPYPLIYLVYRSMDSLALAMAASAKGWLYSRKKVTHKVALPYHFNYG